MVSHIAAGILGLWPIFVFPVFGIDPPDAGDASSQTAGSSAPGEDAPKYVYSISCVEGSTGKKTFVSVDAYCGALRAEQVCAETAGFFADVQGCP